VSDPWRQYRRVARKYAELKIEAIVVDGELGYDKLGQSDDIHYIGRRLNIFREKARATLKRRPSCCYTKSGRLV
jgi:hypothetical protein